MSILRGFCTNCGYSHAPRDRVRLIRRMAGVIPPIEIIAAWPCFYDDGLGLNGAGYRMLMRDLAALRVAAAPLEARA